MGRYKVMPGCPVAHLQMHLDEIEKANPETEVCAIVTQVEEHRPMVHGGKVVSMEGIPESTEPIPLTFCYPVIKKMKPVSSMGKF